MAAHPFWQNISMDEEDRTNDAMSSDISQEGRNADFYMKCLDF